MRWTHRFLLRFKFYQNFVTWSKTYVLPGFAPLPLYNVLAFFVHEIQERTLLNRASSLAYNFMLAFFPATIFLFTLIPYIPIKNFQGQLLKVLSTILPYNAYMAFQATIEDIVRRHNGKLLSIGFITALYFATNGIVNLMRAFNRSSLIIEKRTWIKRRAIATVLTLVISVSLLVAITVMTGGEALVSILKHHIDSKGHFWIYIIKFSRWVIVIAIFFITISLLYRYGPANKQKWNFLSTGSIMATILAVLSSLGFTYYIDNFSSYNKVYGSIGTLIILMLWLYLNSLILLIGFELNASIEYSKRNIKIAKPMFNTFRQNQIS
ncbi:YihY/virulence factor BrkB family protein [Mucilaginibacter sp. X4EP1]|uniref:YihY/virulence factor BrkB family protein n=1 Tax=Mucilaginibacter sp. X4EP1 TaxID=2723092 RepID=UPI0021670053|nr:YihY/virulence factor BrkB family protein [Mucilaginibacter sp. X4EP1]MCS3815035.1 membrane protein [Mucilaginibacter sp. X4EP1]